MVGIVWSEKLSAIGLGVVLLLAGAAYLRFGASHIASLNKRYENLPGRFQYPSGFHRLMAGIIVAFATVVIILAAVLAGR